MASIEHRPLLHRPRPGLFLADHFLAEAICTIACGQRASPMTAGPAQRPGLSCPCPPGTPFLAAQLAGVGLQLSRNVTRGGTEGGVGNPVRSVCVVALLGRRGGRASERALPAAVCALLCQLHGTFVILRCLALLLLQATTTSTAACCSSVGTPIGHLCDGAGPRYCMLTVLPTSLHLCPVAVVEHPPMLRAASCSTD